MTSRVLVTGGGYVGSVLCEELLLYGHEVICIDNFHKGNCDHLFGLVKEYSNFSFHYCDINHEEEVKKHLNGVHAILNTAAIVGFPACSKYQVLAEATHKQGVWNLLENKEEDTVFIQFSTDSVYGKNDDYCNEETTPNPVSLYGETKLAAEELVSVYPNTVILRFSTGMGVSRVMRCNLLINDFVYSAVKNKRIDVFEPDVSRSFINVLDMAEITRKFMEKKLEKTLKYSLYNVGSDDLNYTKREVAEIIKSKTGCELGFIEGKDTDCRNYKISHSRQYSEKIKPCISIDTTIDQLIRAVPLIEWQRKYQ